MKVSVEQVYTSVACNRKPEVVDWNYEGIICYGACNAVVICDPNEKTKDRVTVLSHHTGHVNSVKWIHNHNGQTTELLSCSVDKTAVIWTLQNGHWNVTSILKGHTEGVTNVYGNYHGDRLTIYTASTDSTIKVWERIEGTVTLKQSISLHSGLCLTLHAQILPCANKPLLLCALDDHKIHIFVGEDYHRAHTLVGHEDWVRGLDVLEVDNDTIIVASASQDTYIRLWRIQKVKAQPESKLIKVEEKVFHAYDNLWSVKLEAVLAGHEAWVYGVQWHPYSFDGPTKKPVYRLLSSSLDKTLIIWEPDSSSTDEGVWVEKVRVGEVGGGGLGFYGSRFGPEGMSFLGHGYNGSFHIWTFDKESEQWSPSVVCGGHFMSVEDVAWEPRQGRYLLSVSADQTTRLHAPVRRSDGSVAWHELARPQIHGYDMSAVAPLTATTFASAAEEKVIRVFTAPHNFISNFKNLVGEVLVADDEKGPEGASVPSLGLSNKAVFIEEQGGSGAGDDGDGYFAPVDMKEPPTEETLVQNTLWPELQKLYGHGGEVFALHAAPDGTLLASAARATDATHAALVLWETSKWQQMQKIESHTLTITQLAFSPDSQKLLSVSRDRRWTLYRRLPGSSRFEVAATSDKSNGVHSRIVWCCAWAPDARMFATGSRDGKVCLWAKSDTTSDTSLKEYALLGSPLEAGASVTALACTGRGARCVLAVGLETGAVDIYRADDWHLLHRMDHSSAHHLTVKRLTFNPKYEGSDETLLASAGADHVVRIHRLKITY